MRLDEILLEGTPKILGPGAKQLYNHPNPPCRALHTGPVPAKLKNGKKVKLIKTRWFNGTIEWLTDAMAWIRDSEVLDFDLSKLDKHVKPPKK